MKNRGVAKLVSYGCDIRAIFEDSHTKFFFSQNIAGNFFEALPEMKSQHILTWILTKGFHFYSQGLRYLFLLNLDLNNKTNNL